MKKRAFFILGVVALSAVSSAATIAVMRGMDRNDGRNISYAAASAESDIFRQNPAVDVAFASSVVSTDYPDLTYAAENAVKAVVNIEAIQQAVETPSWSSSDSRRADTPTAVPRCARRVRAARA